MSDNKEMEEIAANQIEQRKRQALPPVLLPRRIRGTFYSYQKLQSNHQQQLFYYFIRGEGDKGREKKKETIKVRQQTVLGEINRLFQIHLL